MKQKRNNLSDNNVQLFIRYLIVGGCATVVEWCGFWIFHQKMGIQYLLATTIAFAISTFANWAIGRLLAFSSSHLGIIKELIGIYLTAIVGLLLNLAIMYVLVDFLKVNSMAAKMLATVLVFMYNFLVRKKIIYKK